MNLRLLSIVILVVFVALIPFGLGNFIVDAFVLANNAGIGIRGLLFE